MKKIIELIKQNRFYSIMLVLNTAVTITYIMITVLLSALTIGNFGSEPNRSRSYHIEHFNVKNGEKINVFWGANKKFVQEVFRDIKEIDFYSIVILQGTSGRFVKENNVNKSLNQITADQNIFKLYKYDFVEGAPFTKEDIESANKVIVISKSAAFKLFGKSEGVLGKYVKSSTDRNDYKVVGVIENPSAIFERSYTEVIMPLDINNDYAIKTNAITGRCSVRSVIKKGSTEADVDESINAAIVDFGKKYFKKEGQVVTVTKYGSNLPLSIPTVFVCVFLLIPVINGLGNSSSYIANRLSEIAIRRAYGATNKEIIGLILFENIAMSITGALIGLVASYPLVLKILNLLYARETVAIPVDVIFNYQLYLILVIVLVIFNLFTIYLPLRKVLKSQISDLIK
ncbi:MAG: ABC transporter permease [Rikenellaceae bacterium]